MEGQRSGLEDENVGKIDWVKSASTVLVFYVNGKHEEYYLFKYFWL